MGEYGDFTIHASRLGRWSECEAREVHELKNPKEVKALEGAPHIASWIGSAAHAVAAGEKLPPDPGTAKFDHITPVMSHARMQANDLGMDLKDRIDRQRLRVLEREQPLSETIDYDTGCLLVGTPDLVCSLGKEAVIIDLKTARVVHTAWLQLAAYVRLYRATIAEYYTYPKGVLSVGIMQLRRTPLGTPPAEISTEYRSADTAMKSIRPLLDRITRILSGAEEPIANPGTHCSYCTKDCAVRPPFQEV